MDEGGFVLDYRTAPGTSLQETDREIGQLEDILKRDPYVSTYSRLTGAGLGGDLKESYQGDLFVRLIDSSKRPPIYLSCTVGSLDAVSPHAANGVHRR